MKKITFLISIFVLLTAFTCENEPLEGDFETENQQSCVTAAQNTQLAALAFLEFTEETYTELCVAYRNALQAQIQFCGDPDGSLQTQINSLGNCSLDNETDDCASAAAAVGVAQAAFAQATSSNYTELCNAYRDTLLDLIEFCGDDGGTQSVLNDLGDCTQTNNSSGTLSVTVGTLSIQFIANSVVLESGMVMVEGSNTEQGANYFIEFQVPEGTTGVDVMQNFKLTLGSNEFFPNTDGFDDFTNTITVNSGGVIQGTFGGIVTSPNGADLSLSQGIVDLEY